MRGRQRALLRRGLGALPTLLGASITQASREHEPARVVPPDTYEQARDA
jgi:hypothetical protein